MSTITISIIATIVTTLIATCSAIAAIFIFFLNIKEKRRVRNLEALEIKEAMSRYRTYIFYLLSPVILKKHGGGVVNKDGKIDIEASKDAFSKFTAEVVAKYYWGSIPKNFRRYFYDLKEMIENEGESFDSESFKDFTTLSGKIYDEALTYINGHAYQQKDKQERYRDLYNIDLYPTSNN